MALWVAHPVVSQNKDSKFWNHSTKNGSSYNPLTSVMSFCPRAGRLVTLMRLSTIFFLEAVSLGSFWVTMYLFTLVSSSIFCSRLSGVAPALCQIITDDK